MRRTRVKARINFLGVDSGDSLSTVSNDKIRGIFRIRGEYQPTCNTHEIHGICTEVTIDTKKTLMDTDNKPFFYGDKEDLSYNYYARDIPIELLMSLGDFTDRHYTYRRQATVGREFGFVKIPVEEMMLSDYQLTLLHTIIPEVAERLPDLMQNLRPVKIRETYKESMKGFEHIFSHFPLELKEAALKNDSFYMLGKDANYKELVFYSKPT